MEEIKDRLKKLRGELKLKQREMADALRVTVSAYGAWETGRDTIPEARLMVLCSRYNVREEWLKTGEGEMFEPEIEPETPSFEDEMYEMYKQLAPEYQEVWKHVADLILNGKPTDEKIKESVIPKKPQNVNVNASINGNHNTQEVHVK